MTTKVEIITDKDLGQIFQISTTKGDTLGFFNSPGIAFTASDVDDQGAKTPIDLTGVGVKVQLRTSTSSSSSEMDFDSVDSSINITDAVDGNFVLHKTATEMNALKPGAYIFDIQFTNGAEVSTWTRGRWNHQIDITA